MRSLCVCECADDDDDVDQVDGGRRSYTVGRQNLLAANAMPRFRNTLDECMHKMRLTSAQTQVAVVARR